MQIFEVGNQFPVKIPSEGVLLNIVDSGIDVIFNFSRPSRDEIAAFKSKTPLTIHMGEIKDILVWGIETPAFSCDCMYIPAAGKSPNLQSVSEGCGYITFFFLVDYSTNKLVAQRMISLSTDFSRNLKHIVDQMNKKHHINFDQAISDLYSKYPTTKSLLKKLLYTFSI